MSNPRSIAMVVLGTLSLFAAIAGCSLIPGAAGPTLADRQFLSVDVVDGGAPRALVPGTRIRLDFRAADLTASAGCNTIGGTYRIDNGKLVVDGTGTTAMGCDAPRHEQDQWLSEFLASRPAISLAGNDLTLQGDGLSIRLQDAQVAEPDLELTETTWTLDSIVIGDTASSVPAGLTATLVFHGDGTVDVAPGCNRGSGTWSAAGGGIAISEVALTKMACDGPAGMLESQVLDVLRAGAAAPGGALAASIDANRLTLEIGGRGLVFHGS